jgi:beta-lactamase superfamily II metal-dependent hydrolase
VPDRKAATPRKKTPAGPKKHPASKRNKAVHAGSRSKDGAQLGSGATESGAENAAAGSAPAARGGNRVRMYRVGFGDFFLLTLQTPDGPKHILIDCGVHAGDLHSIRDAVDDMAQVTGKNLALLIMTHRHADHISGFATCRDIFSTFSVERIWMSWFENPDNDDARKFQANLTAVASRLAASLQARQDPDAQELRYMAENIVGPPLGIGGVSSNAVALNVLHGNFNGKKPETDYYQAGDHAKLPQGLINAGLTAQILGPPIDPSLVAQMNGKNEQYLAEEEEQPDYQRLKPPFPQEFTATSADFPADAFGKAGPSELEQQVKEVQPDLLAAKARQADNTLNNQSLVILFTFGGKRLLFVGDAQWGNWENFLFGGRVTTDGHAVLTEQSKQILGGLDFYKVGHHGSSNATPIDAVNALHQGCVAMCSTQPGCYGSVSRGTEVPRGPLLEALNKKTNHQLARSDEIPAQGHQPTPGAGPLPPVFKSPPAGLYIDYDF